MTLKYLLDSSDSLDSSASRESEESSKFDDPIIYPEEVWFQNRRAKWRKKENTKKGPGRPAHNSHPQTCSGDPLSAEEILKRECERREKKLRKQLERQVKRYLTNKLKSRSTSGFSDIQENISGTNFGSQSMNEDDTMTSDAVSCKNSTNSQRNEHESASYSKRIQVDDEDDDDNDVDDYDEDLVNQPGGCDEHHYTGVVSNESRQQQQQQQAISGLSSLQQLQTVLDQIENTVDELRALNKSKPSKDLFGHETCSILCNDPLIQSRHITDKILSQSETFETLISSLATSKSSNSSRSKYKILNGTTGSSSNRRRRSSSTKSSTENSTSNSVLENQQHNQLIYSSLGNTNNTKQSFDSNCGGNMIGQYRQTNYSAASDMSYQRDAQSVKSSDNDDVDNSDSESIASNRFTGHNIIHSQINSGKGNNINSSNKKNNNDNNVISNESSNREFCNHLFGSNLVSENLNAAALFNDNLTGFLRQQQQQQQQQLQPQQQISPSNMFNNYNYHQHPLFGNTVSLASALSSSAISAAAAGQPRQSSCGINSTSASPASSFNMPASLAHLTSIDMATENSEPCPTGNGPNGVNGSFELQKMFPYAQMAAVAAAAATATQNKNLPNDDCDIGGGGESNCSGNSVMINMNDDIPLTSAAHLAQKRLQAGKKFARSSHGDSRASRQHIDRRISSSSPSSATSSTTGNLSDDACNLEPQQRQKYQQQQPSSGKMTTRHPSSDVSSSGKRRKLQPQDSSSAKYRRQPASETTYFSADNLLMLDNSHGHSANKLSNNKQYSQSSVAPIHSPQNRFTMAQLAQSQQLQQQQQQQQQQQYPLFSAEQQSKMFASLSAAAIAHGQQHPAMIQPSQLGSQQQQQQQQQSKKSLESILSASGLQAQQFGATHPSANPLQLTAEAAQYQQAMLLQQHLFLSQLAMSSNRSDNNTLQKQPQQQQQQQLANSNIDGATQSGERHALNPFNLHNDLMIQSGQLNHHLPPPLQLPAPSSYHQKSLLDHNESISSRLGSLDTLMLARNLASSMSGNIGGSAGGSCSGNVAGGALVPPLPAAASNGMFSSSSLSLLNQLRPRPPMLSNDNDGKQHDTRTPFAAYESALLSRQKEQQQQQQQQQVQQQHGQDQNSQLNSLLIQQQTQAAAMNFIHQAAQQHLQLRLAAAAAAAAAAASGPSGTINTTRQAMHRSAASATASPVGPSLPAAATSTKL